MNHLGFVALTVYMKNDYAEVARLVQMLVRQPLHIERLNAHLVPCDTSRVNGLEDAGQPVVRVAIIATTESDAEIERVTKALNRLIAVFKVVVDFSPSVPRGVS